MLKTFKAQLRQEKLRKTSLTNQEETHQWTNQDKPLHLKHHQNKKVWRVAVDLLTTPV